MLKRMACQWRSAHLGLKVARNGTVLKKTRENCRRLMPPTALCSCRLGPCAPGFLFLLTHACIQCEAHAQQLLRAPASDLIAAVTQQDVAGGAFGENLRVKECEGCSWEAATLCIG
jgi:hypothetical protein